MKKIFIIIFESDKEMLNGSENIAEYFEKSSDSKVYSGSWGKIQFNKDECLNAISVTVNQFIQTKEKKEIYFGCNIKDALEIKPLLTLKNCELAEVPYCKFVKNCIL